MIEVLRPGQYSTLQDLGRYGYRALGVPVSGPMDRASAIFANRLLGNNDNAPDIEMCLVGAHLLFRHACTIAFSGGECQIYVNEIQTLKLN